jgi:single-strand DNA-binding protein
MFNEAHISLSGYVASQPYYKETRTGVPSLTMRVAWTPRRMDRVTGEWVDADTSFLSVNCYRKLAENAATCVRKGDPVVIRGRVSVRDFEDKKGRQRTSVDVDAISVGHDLGRGVATFQRVRPQTGMTAMEYRASEEGLPGGTAGPDGLLEAGLPDDPEGDRDSIGALDSVGLPGDSGGEMFDEDAVGALAEEPAGVTAPF